MVGQNGTARHMKHFIFLVGQNHASRQPLAAVGCVINPIAKHLDHTANHPHQSNIECRQRKQRKQKTDMEKIMHDCGSCRERTLLFEQLFYSEYITGYNSHFATRFGNGHLHVHLGLHGFNIRRAAMAHTHAEGISVYCPLVGSLHACHYAQFIH